MSEEQHAGGQKLVRVPELLSIICTFLGASDCKNVVSVSRRWFRAATPVVWMEVTGIHHLFALFPYAVINPTGNIISIRLPQLLDFTRFDTYAPLVKYLDLYGDSKHSYEFTDWRTLSQRQSPLLPHLSSLTIRGVGGSRGYGDQLMWTTLLASSSLRQIRSVISGKGRPRPSSVSLATASLLLNKITTQSPDLQVLSIFPDPSLAGAGNNAERPLEAFLRFSEPPFHHYLSRALQLRELTSNEQVLQLDVLPVIASLPLLSHLEIFTTSIDIDPDELQLPKTAFPSLRSLSLHLTSNDDIADLWGIHALRQLTSIHIEFQDQHKEDLDDPDSWARNILSTIARNSPNLQHLHINFSLCDSCGDEPCNLGNVGLLEELSTLPLVTVVLKSAWFGHYDPDIYDCIANAFPEVIDLRMPDQDATIQELSHFAKLPKLQHLLLELDFTSGLESVMPSTTPVGLALHTLETEEASLLLGDLFTLAKDLLILWPNLQRVVCPEADTSGAKLLRRTLTQSLNSSIMMVREATKLKQRIAEKFGSAESTLFDALPTVDYLFPKPE